MFIDRVRIKVSAGGGGAGCCSFRREKYVPHGGPNGGDGGHGGAIYFEANDRFTTLLDLKYHAHWKGNRGEHGRGSDQHGKNGEDTIIAVPPGTVVRDWESKKLLVDLAEHGERYLAAASGKGGRGNARFATSTNRAPRFAELGEPGDENEYFLELKLIADVGIVGLPNAGKSTLLSRVTAATPKIADYPFTTLSPNLGVAQLSDYRTITIADIPGIIEGAAEGKGLGHDFLRHIERTKILLFLIDPGDEDPCMTIEILANELAQHSKVFEQRPRFVAFNKADVTENRARYEAAASQLSTHVYYISAVTGEGVTPLLESLWNALEELKRRDEDIGLETTGQAEYTYSAPYEVIQTEDGFRIEGRRVIQTVRMTDFNNDEAVEHMQSSLKRMGLFKALKRLGAQDGQSIHIGSIELEYQSE